MNKLVFVFSLMLFSGTVCAQVPNTSDSGEITADPTAIKVQDPASKEVAEPVLNQVYVKIIMPIQLAHPNKDRPTVESWIAEDLKKLGQADFTAVSGWMSVELCPITGVPMSDVVWGGGEVGDGHYCPVAADIPYRAEGRVKVVVDGWSPGLVKVTVALPDEPGARVIVPVEQLKIKKGMAYVAVLIGPPPANSAAPTGGRK